MHGKEWMFMLNLWLKQNIIWLEVWFQLNQKYEGCGCRYYFSCYWFFKMLALVGIVVCFDGFQKFITSFSWWHFASLHIIEVYHTRCHRVFSYGTLTTMLLCCNKIVIFQLVRKKITFKKWIFSTQDKIYVIMWDNIYPCFFS